MKRSRDRLDADTELTVWRSVPSSLPPLRQTPALPLEQIDPQIRVAHRRGADAPHLTLPERVIVDHEILLILSGRGELRFRSDVVPFGPHEVLFVRPFVPHTLSGRGNVDHIAVHFDFSTKSALEMDLNRRHPYALQFAGGVELPVKQRVAPRGTVERSLELVVEHFSRRTADGDLRARGEFLCALSVLLTPQDHPRGEVGRRRAQLERATTFMREHVEDTLTNKDLQRASSLGSSQLNALFREFTGYTPMEYLRRLRIDMARELLGNAELSIKEVAARVGFSEPNHFSRVFAQVDGVPPTAYREALLIGKSSRRS
jgi:AraC-like DNA-binding protein